MTADNSSGQGAVHLLRVDRPCLGNNTADAERLLAALERSLAARCAGKAVRTPCLPTTIAADLPGCLRRWDHRVKAVVWQDERGPRVVSLSNPDERTPVCGVAMDLGTTRVVLRLVNLETGDVLGEKGFDNPQIQVGPDVLARIHHAGHPGGRRRLQELIIKGMSRALENLTREAGLTPAHVHLVTGAGNTVMTHLFLGLDPMHIIREPYIPAVNAPGPVYAGDLNLLLHPHALVYLFPNIGAYFGGDLISGILFAGLHDKPDPCIMVDVGTNAEVVVGGRDWLMACAGAAGPALEGGISDMGMTAGPGVIDRVVIDPDTLEMDLHTIGEHPPVGVCGSGMIDLAAQLFLSGMVDIRGKLVPERCGRRYFETEGIPHIRLVTPEESGTGQAIVFSQVDLNSLTSAKAAMHTILEVIVCQSAGLEFEDLERFYVAGTFGSFINPQSAIAIGMLPDMPLDRFEVLGNSSLGGAALLLAEPWRFEEVCRIRRHITYIELNVNASFMTTFSGAKFYPHTDRSRFPSVRLFGEA